jgi:hypothetical protein
MAIVYQTNGVFSVTQSQWNAKPEIPKVELQYLRCGQISKIAAGDTFILHSAF